MIKNWKIVECSFCHKEELMTKKDSMYGCWWVPPAGWKEVNRKTHFCPRCNEAICRQRILIEEKRKDEEAEK